MLTGPNKRGMVSRGGEVGRRGVTRRVDETGKKGKKVTSDYKQEMVGGGRGSSMTPRKRKRDSSHGLWLLKKIGGTGKRGILKDHPSIPMGRVLRGTERKSR